MLKEREKCGGACVEKFKVKVVNSKLIYSMTHKHQMLLPDVLLVWSCLSPGTSVVLVHPEVWIRSQNPSSKSHLLYLEPSTGNTKLHLCSFMYHPEIYFTINLCVGTKLWVLRTIKIHQLSRAQKLSGVSF